MPKATDAVSDLDRVVSLGEISLENRPEGLVGRVTEDWRRGGQFSTVTGKDGRW